MVRVAGGLLAGHLVLQLVLANQHFSCFAECLEQLLSHRAGWIDVEFLLQVGNAGFALLHHQATAGLFQPGNDLHLGGLASSVDAHQANAVSRPHLPGDIPQHLASGINLAEAFEAEHG